MNGSSTSGGAAVPWSQVSLAPAPAWAEAPSFDRNLPAKDGLHATYLAWERQVNLAAEASFHATAVRLETALAVQHQSQWRLNIDPRFQHVKLHWLRVVRGAESSDRLRRDRMRLIQRETQLEHLVIDGQWTLLIVLDDVRVGDIIEAGYSVEGRDPIRPGGCDTFFAVPAGLVVGSYRLRVEFDSARGNLNYLASPDAPERTMEPLADGRTRWSWEGRQTNLREPEPNHPTTFLDYIWIQVSDLPDWPSLSTRLAHVWMEQEDDVDLGQFPGFARPSVVDEAAVHQFIRHVQDDFRYLSVDLESGGWIPARPSVVAQRLYGDCKDLVWLAATVLRTWGVAARPILVGTGLRERVQTMRPTPLLFNHAVLEVELAGQARWFDLTMRQQGGDFRSQPVPWYGCGLPVEPNSALCTQPGPRSRGLYAIRETIGLDTRRGEKSIVEVRVWAEAWNADHLRRNRLTQGADEFAKERLAAVRRRYGKAERLGALQWRDDRARNICEVAEAFEIPDACYPDESGQRALFDVPANILIQTLVVPEAKPRRGPWDLPHRMEIRHEICIRSSSCSSGSRQRRRWDCPEFSASLDEPRDDGTWRKVMRFDLKTDEVAIDRIADFRGVLDRFLQATSWRLYLPPRVNRVLAANAVGALPPPEEGIKAYVGPIDLAGFTDATTTPTETAPTPAARSSTAYDQQNSDRAVWRYAIPVMVLVSMVAARSCSVYDSPSHFDLNSIVPPDRNAQFRSNLPVSDLGEQVDEPLPPGPAIHGTVYKDVSVLDQPAEALYKAEAKYPSALRGLGIGGDVVLDFVVTDQGIPTRITVVTQTNPAFGRAASVALSKWRFRPAMKDGHAVNLALRLPVTFRPDPTLPKKPLFDNSLPGFDQNQSLLPGGPGPTGKRPGSSP